MIENVSSKDVFDFLTKYFDDYKIDTDPFERLAIYRDKEILGAISYSVIYERAEINYIAVSLDCRKNVIASKLLEYAINDMIKSGVCSVSLEVESDNIAAINLYLKYGFIKKAIRKNYYGNNDGYLMVRELEVR